MVITRKKKEKILDIYKKNIQESTNIVFVKQERIWVNLINDIRRKIKNLWWKLLVVKKKLFYKSLLDLWIEMPNIESLEWSVIILFNFWNWFDWIKSISKYNNERKKNKLLYSFEFLWWVFEKNWKDREYVKVLSTISSKEELLWKMLYVFKSPMSKLVWVLSEISKKQSV